MLAYCYRSFLQSVPALGFFHVCIFANWKAISENEKVLLVFLFDWKHILLPFSFLYIMNLRKLLHLLYLSKKISSQTISSLYLSLVPIWLVFTCLSLILLQYSLLVAGIYVYHINYWAIARSYSYFTKIKRFSTFK